MSAQAPMEKVCSHCRSPKPIFEFHARASQCKSCRIVLMREHYVKNKMRRGICTHTPCRLVWCHES
jgi:hypothetical protein